MKKTTRYIFLEIAIICVAFTVTVVLCYLYCQPVWHPGHSPPTCTLCVTENETCWKITVTNVSADVPGWLSANKVHFGLSRTLYNDSKNYTSLEHGYIQKIDGIPSSGYNITWLDKDENDLLSKGDKFIISKSGGSVGKAIEGDEFVLVGEWGNEIAKVSL
ncbi:MAG: hypothetical protein QMC80_05135 [Thermoplasmatales archaeon]|nr:hypothetical protein [Thermoplasmatales archaeon]